MSTYEDHTGPIRISSNTFRDKLRECLDRKIRGGQEGIDPNAIYDKTRHLSKVYRNHRMNDDIFELACSIHAKGIELDYKQWVYWMTDAEIKVTGAEVMVYHRSYFYCELAAKNVGKAIEKYYNKPIIFVIDANIHQRVAA